MEDHIILMYVHTPSYLEHQCELGKNNSCLVKGAILLAHKNVSCNEEDDYSCSYPGYYQLSINSGNLLIYRTTFSKIVRAGS